MTYGDYGAVTKTTGTVDTPFKYAGRLGVITDGDGLVYLKTRYYNPQLMRFMNRDTVAGSVTDSQSLNRFSYVEGNPLTYVDLNGQARTWLTDNVGFLGGLGWDALEFVPILGNVMSAVDLIGDLASGANVLTIGMDLAGIFGGGELKGIGRVAEFASRFKPANFNRIGELAFDGISDFDKLGNVDRFGNSSSHILAFSNKISDGDIRATSFGSSADLDGYTKSFVQSQKPKNAPDVNKWISKGGKIDIDNAGTWTYTNKAGDFVPYVDGFPDFKAGGYVRQEVNIGSIGNYRKDFAKADELAPLGARLSTSTWHHYQDAKTMQEVPRYIYTNNLRTGVVCLY